MFIIPLCPLYCNTLLANLNVRAYVRGEPTAHDAGGDLFTSATSPMSNIPKIDKHHGLEESNMVSPTHQVGVHSSSDSTCQLLTIVTARCLEDHKGGDNYRCYSESAHHSGVHKLHKRLKNLCPLCPPHWPVFLTIHFPFPHHSFICASGYVSDLVLPLAQSRHTAVYL